MADVAVPTEVDEASSHLAALSSRVLTDVLSAMGGGHRAGQVTMVEEICRAITSNERLLVQAGTGTGKSIGYLVPTMTYCASAQARAVISTATLALQRQILVKDAPVVADTVATHTGVQPTVALLKGWNNYLCPYRLAGGYPDEGTLFDVEHSPVFARATGGPSSQLAAEIMELRQWAKETDTGDRDDLVPGPSERAWRHVSVSKRECLGRACPMVEECFAQRARDRAAEADVIVTNHTLLGIHATGEADLFTDIDMVIVDEAHELAERVRAQASASFSAGQLARVARAARTHAAVDTQDFETAATALVDAINELPAGLLAERDQVLSDAVRGLDNAAREALTQVQASSSDAAAKALARAALDEVMGTCGAWNRVADESITWIQRPDDGGQAELVIAPLHVASAIGTAALGDAAAVLTSATLRLGGTFDAIAYDCGLNLAEQPWRAIDVGTPFDEAKQGIIYVAEHLPMPGQAGVSDEALAELVELVQASGGGALALFSSWKGAQAGAAALREKTDFTVYLQGEESASSLITQFRHDVDSCLVGTLGLWQGVDVPGASCRLVIIDRIPFPHPDDPVSKALTKDAQRRRLNGFWTVSLPKATLLMAQGAGRLLRTVNDRGVVAVLDCRLVTKGYGAVIRSSMPAMWPTTNGTLVRQALRRLADEREA
ncbi:ATP-dependent DNA helicase [Schaalia suimastitidis]|uniref:ATP-dependent DNA helicase n=1 Tax=Schaalia suimastitidis TaxID=121163 RepID=UPI00040F2EC8|nr:ATP-dependent DNA helicase [Schaalia suimastitidis]